MQERARGITGDGDKDSHLDIYRQELRTTINLSHYCTEVESRQVFPWAPLSLSIPHSAARAFSTPTPSILPLCWDIPQLGLCAWVSLWDSMSVPME